MGSNLRIGIIGIPNKWSTETLADSIEQETGYRLVIDMAGVKLNLDTHSLYYKDVDLCQLDGLIIKKISAIYSPNTLDRLELLRIAESQGVKIFSKPESIMRLIDRLSCTVSLRNAGLPMPKTWLTESEDEAIEIVQQFSSAVFKPLYSTKARGMCIIDKTQSENEIRRQIKTFKIDNPMMYIQQKVNLPGQDLGLVFLAGKYLGAYARVNQSGAWNTTINSGGRYAKHLANENIIALAKQAQDIFNLDFTTVDIAETDQGPIVFEVSAFGGFQGAKDGIGINAAQMYAHYVIEKCQE